MRERKIEIAFGGGFMYVFEDQREDGIWGSLTAGTVKTEAGGGVSPHNLILQHLCGSVVTDLKPTKYEGQTAWDLAGCRVEIETDQVSSGVLAPLDAGAPPPADEKPTEAWHNWQWVLNPVALHRRLGHTVTPLRRDWPDKLTASVAIKSGFIVPDPGFPSAVLTVAGRPVQVPLTNETRWSSNHGATEVVLHVSGARDGRLSVTPERDVISLKFFHDERRDFLPHEIADLEMIYGLINVASAQRITKGVIPGGVVPNRSLDTPRKLCGSARFILE